MMKSPTITKHPRTLSVTPGVIFFYAWLEKHEISLSQLKQIMRDDPQGFMQALHPLIEYWDAEFDWYNETHDIGDDDFTNHLITYLRSTNN